MSAVLEADRLGKRYGPEWALADCSFRLAPGQVAALIGPNGAGKSTLLELAIGLLSPSEGEVRVLGASPTREPTQVLPNVGFVAQEHPLYRGFSVEEMLRFGREMNPGWDHAFAMERVRQLGLPLKQRLGRLSGGQQAQVALILALAKRPQLLLLDEPIAAFDPLARREFLGVLMESVADTGTTVLLSSHILGDLERVCDSVLVLSRGHVSLSDSIDEILASHRVVIGPVREEMLASCVHTVINSSRSERQVATLVRIDGPLVLGDAWSVHEPTLEDVVLAYLQPRDTTVPQGVPA